MLLTAARKRTLPGIEVGSNLEQLSLKYMSSGLQLRHDSCGQMRKKTNYATLHHMPYGYFH